MNTLLEVAIGLFFVFLLFSLVVSAVNEAILGHLFNLRSRVLEDCIHVLLSSSSGRYSPLTQIQRTLSWIGTPGKRMISWLDQALRGLDSSPPNQRIGQRLSFRRLISWLNQILSPSPDPSPPDRRFSDDLIKHPLVLGLTVGNQRCPAYLPSQIFVDAVLGTLLDSDSSQSSPPWTDEQHRVIELKEAVNQLADPWAQKVLGTVLIGTRSLDEARQRLESWFNHSMQRVTGVYKRYTQFWLYVWATLIVVFLNVDTVEITRRLLTDAQFRSNLAANAADFISRTNIMSAFAATNAPTATNSPISARELLEEINKLKLPLGWGVSNQASSNHSRLSTVVMWPLLKQNIEPTNSVASLLAGEVLSPAAPLPRNAQEWHLKILGLLITIAAISQGAPFWFDLLNKLANLRAAGPPPQVNQKSPGPPGISPTTS